jgi:hypothetical protein
MRNLLPSLLLLLSPALAGAAPTPLSTLDQVEQLCHDLQPHAQPMRKDVVAQANADLEQTRRKKAALDREYLLTLPPGQFRFSEADADTRSLTVDTQKAFPAVGGRATLYPVDQTDIDLVLLEGQPFPPSSEGMSLELVVRPGEDSEPSCTASHARTFALGIEIVDARLVDPQGKLVAKWDQDEFVDKPLPAGEGKPEVDVEPAWVESSGVASKTVTDGVSKLRPQLADCYKQGLVREPSLDGCMVLSFEVSGEGKPGDIVVVADSVQDEQVAACVTQTLAGSKLIAMAPPAKPDPASARRPRGVLNPGRASVSVRFERR